MKKTLAVAVAVSFVLGLAISSYAAEVKEYKQTEKVSGAKTTETETMKVKTTEGKEIKAKETVTTDVRKPGEVDTTTELKGERGKATRTTTEDASGKVAGTTKVDIKKGSLDEFKIDWTYEKVPVTGGGFNYVIRYEVKENKNPSLGKELGPDMAAKLKKGTKGEIRSTSEYTAGDVQQNFRTYILKDLKTVIAKEQAPAK